MEETFNVKIVIESKEVTLTILQHKDYYKVIYFGGIMGAVRKADQSWKLLVADEIEAGDLPQYTPGLKDDRIEFVLDKHTVNKIGVEIEHYFFNQSK